MLASTGAPIEGVLTGCTLLDVDGSLPQPTSTAATSVHSGVTVFNLTLRVTCCRKRILLETFVVGTTKYSEQNHNLKEKNSN
jgi:hypothetical protein